MGEPDQNRAESERGANTRSAEADRCLELQRQLGRANAEFEEFVSLAAHSLREPLRDVAAFSQLIAEANRLDSDSTAHLDRIRQGAIRAQSLLTDIVDYWTAVAGDSPTGRTDMEAVFVQALLLTDSRIAERSAIVTHDPLPAVTGNFQVLAKVLHHLIRNAIEYCDTPPRLHVSCRREALEWVFSVRDNGPGIEPAFQQRIFGVFKRLHGSAYPGNGLGLAFCKKAVEWQGGRIWVESAPGAGSTFYFTVPRNPQAENSV